MLENANRETVRIWHHINDCHATNRAVSEIVIASLKRHSKPQRVCAAVAADVRSLIVKQCPVGGVYGDLADFALMRVDWELLSRAIMNEVIFGEINNV